MRETQVVYRCDVCGEAGAETCEFRVQKGYPWRADLCDQHKTQVLNIMQQGTEVIRKQYMTKPLQVRKRKPTAVKRTTKKTP